MNTHHLSTEEITAYLDGQCTEVELLNARTHLEACGDCQREVRDLRMVKQLLGDLDEPMLPRSFALPAEYAKKVAPVTPISSPITPMRPAASVRRFEPVLKYLSIAAVLAVILLGSAQMAGYGDRDKAPTNNNELTTETNVADNALEDQEPALARGELREQGDSAAANVSPLSNQHANVDTPAQATASGLTPLEITTVSVGIVALALISGWILIHYRAGSISQ